MKILITKEAFLKMQGYIDLAEGEISGIGKIVKDGNNIIVVDVRLLRQKNTGTTSEIEEGADIKFIQGLIKDGESPEDWKLWWHSHAEMGVFWSGTDSNTIGEHMKSGIDGKNNGSSFFVSIVGNKKAEYKARIDVSTYDANFGIRGVETRDDLPFERIIEPELEKKISSIQIKKEKLEAKMEKLTEDIMNIEIEIESVLSIEEDDNIIKNCERDIKKNVIEREPIIYNKSSGYRYNNNYHGHHL